MVRKNFKVGGFDASNVNIRSNGFAATLTANASLASNVSFSLPGSAGNLGQVLTTDGSGNLYFSDSSANTQVYVGDTLISNTALILEAGSGVSISTNADSGIVSFSTSMSNITSQTIAVDGSANSFTLAKSVANSHMVLVSYNGLLQGPEEYSVSDTTLTISNSKPLLADSKIEVRYFDFFELPGVGSGGGGGEAYTFQGEVSGYSSGGSAPTGRVDTVDKFSFTSDGNASDVGNLTQSRNNIAGQSSSNNGYVSGGINSPVTFNTVDKFPFSVDANASDVGDLTQARWSLVGQSSSFSGYSSGGRLPATFYNTIDKFPFASDGNASDVGDLTVVTAGAAGQSSDISGYTSGGFTGGGYSNTIDKFPFASDANATDVGDMLVGLQYMTGQSSTISGYISASSSPTEGVTITKFPFATDANATDVGDLTQARQAPAGQSSTSSGYTSGGSIPTGSTNVIDKFSFSSNANATDVGDLTQARSGPAGQQV